MMSWCFDRVAMSVHTGTSSDILSNVTENLERDRCRNGAMWFNSCDCSLERVR